ncbi:MAG: DUF3078 domain-containing protein [Muribaculaceae bacterium]|nr:DUF3078 domain-containing protein [Muribaculaceae bacterium]
MRQLTTAICLGIASLAFAQTTSPEQLMQAARQLNSEANDAQTMLDSNLELADSIANDSIALDSILFAPVVIRDLDEILRSLPDTMPELPYNPVAGPWIFSGYRPLKQRSFENAINTSEIIIEKLKGDSWSATPYTPRWLHDALTQSRISGDLMYSMMIYSPNTVQYTYWDLPVPPRLPEDDVTLGSYIRNLNLPEVAVSEALIPEFEQKKKHWLHNFNTGLQFSQAYVSKNWYQGGNNYLQLLYNFYWDVQLNPTYHPNEIFQSTVTYKLGINSIEQNAVGRKYSLSEDNFQYNVKYGFKAFQRWFYTITSQFKTQFFRNYKTNTDIRSASFLSPADLNLGIGMTYNYANQKKTFNITASIAPLSYNLKVCIDKDIDHTQFNIKPDRKTHSEYGSSGEVNMTWQATSNISMRTRLFAFTDYTYFQGNVETTWDFAINKFLSTQIYANLRYDSSSDFNISRWHHWMLKEILSFGLSYTFSTK